MSDHKNSHVSLYMTVFGALMVLTVLTVAVSRMHLAHGTGLFVGISIAVVKASLVAAVFMHLKWEKRLIFGILGLTAFFAFFLFLLPNIDSSDNRGIRTPQPIVMPAHGAAGPEGGH